MSSHWSRSDANQDTVRQQIAQQQTHPYPTIPSTPHPFLVAEGITGASQPGGRASDQKTRKGPRLIATLLVGGAALLLYFIWKPATPAPRASATTQQPMTATKTLTPSITDASGANGGDIQVYIIGAVQHPGVYTLANDARVYQLLQAAGGALSDANLSVINMAAKLSDGQEIYLPRMGETPIPAMSGTTSGADQTNLVNINTASAEQLRQGLNISSKTAQTIISYRLKHGAFSSIDTLTQVVSKAVFDKIKDKVTIS